MSCRLEHPLPRLRRVDFLSRLPLAWDIHVCIMDPTCAEVFSVYTTPDALSNEVMMNTLQMLSGKKRFRNQCGCSIMAASIEKDLRHVKRSYPYCPLGRSNNLFCAYQQYKGYKVYTNQRVGVPVEKSCCRSKVGKLCARTTSHVKLTTSLHPHYHTTHQ
jgi:hypothetical protein